MLLSFLGARYLRNIENKHIINDVKSALDTTELSIISDFEQLEKLLVYVSETVRAMILQGADFGMVSNYITHITKFMFADEDLKIYTTGLYGFFDVYGGKFHDGTGWQPPEGYAPADRPWYKTAVEANGNVGITESYFAMAVGENTLSFSRRIFDDDGNPLGIVCLDILLDKIREIAVDMQFVHNGYGLLLNSKLEVIAHPHEALWDKAMPEIDRRNIVLLDYLKQGISVIEHRIVNYKGEKSVIFLRQLKNGWYLGVVIPEDAYFKEMKKMSRNLYLAGLILSVLFIVIVLRFYDVRQKLQYFTGKDLTFREKEIFNMLIAGKKLKEIAYNLKVSYNTVLTDQKNMYRKLDVKNKDEFLLKFRPANVEK
jgi:DNA-binding CsgD family transcriptional regulator